MSPKRINSFLFVINVFAIFMMVCGSICYSQSKINPEKVKEISVNEKEWSFVENKGQLTGSDAKFYGQQDGVTLYCKPGSIGFSFCKTESQPNVNNNQSVTGKSNLRLPKQKDIPVNLKTSNCKADLVFLNANPNAQIEASDRQAFYENFYLSGLPEEGVTHVRTYKTITYHNIYPQIDLVLQPKGQGLKYSFIVNPGGNPAVIQIKWNGPKDVDLKDDGSILYSFETNNDKGVQSFDLSENAPVSYQGKSTIQGNFKISNEKTISFNIGNYNKTKTLVIDPWIVWGTYFNGSNGGSNGYAVATDASGNIYLGGANSSTKGLATSGAFQSTGGGGFFTKFRQDGTRVWATYYDAAVTNMVTAKGYIYISGLAGGSSGIATSGAYQISCAGGVDDFLAKFDTSGTRKWGTFYGGNKDEYNGGLSVDSSGNLYLAGASSSKTGIATSGAFETSIKDYGAFLAKFNNSGSLQWGTYLKGNYYETGYGVASDLSGNVYLYGNTDSDSGIATSGTYQSTGSATYFPAFIVKFTGDGKHRIWGTYYGQYYMYCGGIILDKNSNIYICGQTTSSTGIATNGTFLTTYLGGSDGDAFLAKFDTTGSLLWGTYYGDTTTFGTNIAESKQGNIYMTGSTEGKSYISSAGAYRANSNGGDNSFLASFSSLGQRLWGTYYGGNYTEGEDVAVSGTEIYISGYTGSSNGIATHGAFQSSYLGSVSAFLADFGDPVNDAGISSILIYSSKFCPGTTQPVKVILQNYSHTQLDSVTIHCNINGKLQTPYKWKGNIDYFGNDTVTIGNFYFPAINNTITAWTTNPNGVHDSDNNNDTSIVTIATFPLPTAFVGYDSAVCMGDSTFLGTDSIRGHSYTWSSNPVGFSSSKSKVATIPHAATTYYLTEKIKATGCTSSDSIKVVLKPFPKARFNVNDTVACLYGNSFAFKDSSTVSAGKIATWIYDFGDGSGSGTSNKNPSHTYLSDGTHKVILAVSTIYGCIDTTSKNVSIYPASKVAFAINKDTQCLSGNSFVFTSKSTNSFDSILSYKYDFGDGATSNSKNATHTYTSPGKYKVILNVTTDKGCVDTGSNTVTIEYQPVASFNVSGTRQCFASNYFQFTNKSSIAVGTLVSQVYDFGDYTTTSSANPDHTYTKPGTYKIKLVATSDHGCVDSFIKTVFVYPTPVASFKINDSSQCLSGNNFLFTDKTTSVDTVISWSWNFGDHNTSTSQNPAHSYSQPGTYTVFLQVKTKSACTDTISKTVEVHSDLSAAFQLVDSLPCHNGNNFHFKDLSSSADPISSWTWHFGDGDSSAVENPSHLFKKDGTYHISLTAATKFGCKSGSAQTRTITTSPVASFSIIKNTQCLTGNKFIFTNKSSALDSIVSAIWTFGDPAGNTKNPDTVNTQNASHSYGFPGTYPVTLFVKTKAGCTDSFSLPVKVLSNPTVSFHSEGTECFNSNSFTFQDLSSGGSQVIVKWKWSFGDGDSSSVQNPAHVYKSADLFHVQLTATTKEGCADSAKNTVTVNPSPVPQISGAIKVCLNTKAVYKTTLDTGTSYYWVFSGANIISRLDSNNIILDWTDTGRGYVLISETNFFGCQAKDSILVKVNPLPVALWKEHHADSTYIFQALDSSLSRTDYSWTLGDGSPLVKGYHAIHIFPKNKTYTVKLSVSDTDGCSSELDSNINVTISGIAGFITGGLNIKVYPNPFDENTIIECNTSSNTNLRINLYDMNGKLIGNIIDKYIQAGIYQWNIDVANYQLKKGIYILKVITPQGKTNYRLVKM